MKRRFFVKIVSFMSALLVVISVLLGQALLKNENYKMQISYGYTRSFELLNASLNNITVNLQKAMYVTTPLQMSEISTQTFSETIVAKQALSEFPTGEKDLEVINKFLSQTGNYLVYLSKEIINGGKISSEQYNNLKKLRGVSMRITDAVSAMQHKYNNSGYWDSEITGEISAINDDTLANDFMIIEDSLSDYPTLLYDGPYSDHLINSKPSLLEGKSEVSEAQAILELKNMFGEKYDWKFKEVSTGKIPAYEFICDTAYASVTLDGGYVIYFRENSQEQRATIGYNQAVGIAQKFLRNKFNSNFHASYYYTDNGVCVVNFASLNENVICYSDLIKVGIDLSNGNVVFYEAGGYISNHKTREIGEVKYSYSDAKNVLSENLKILTYATALIPSDSNEILCYEFVCKGDDKEEIIVYINSATLQEEEIFILFETDGGTLVK